MYVSTQTSGSSVDLSSSCGDDTEALADASCAGELARDNDHWLNRLYTDSYPAAISHARRLVGAADADDLVQEAFLRVARYRTRANPDSLTIGFIVTVVRNLARTWIVQRRRAQVAGRDLMLACTDRSQPSSRVEEFNNRLHELSDGQREAFVLVDVLGLSEAQAGIALSLSRPVVSVKRRTALATLRERCSG